jgi:uncharacterized integral membrane protein
MGNRQKTAPGKPRIRLIKLVLLLLLVLTLVTVVLQNQESWQVRFLWLSGEVPGIILLFLTAAAGFTVGVAVALRAKRRTTPPQRTR